MTKKKRERIIGTLDFETDPFEHGMDIKPFCCGVWDGTLYYQFWGDDCARQLAEHLLRLEGDHIFYAHNGGRFDFTFLLEWLSPEALIISNRIVVCRIGRCELRDSYAILPVPLKKAGGKIDIDYAKMKRGVRNRHRNEILTYLKQDCLALHGHVLAYRERFGDRTTMAGAAMHQLEKQVTDETGKTAKATLQRLSLTADADMRQFFFGGRVEAFEPGIHHDYFNVYDMTSMYPFCMRRYDHPVSNTWRTCNDLDDADFAVIDATSRGAFPLRKPDGGLHFPHGRGTFRVSGHEIRTARELGLCRIHSVERAIQFHDRRNFSGFVDTFFGLRREARRAGDDTGDLHYKLILNSSYGRFCLNVDRLREWTILPNGSIPDASLAGQWTPGSIGDAFTFWSSPVSEIDKVRAIRNVATGASITGAARSELLRALHRSDRPIYCDTDSVFCRGSDVRQGGEIGEWKHEKSADEAAIAGKKLYALFQDNEPVKFASKGSRLTPEEIRRVAGGEVIEWHAEAPTMGLAGTQRYMKRTIRRTG